MLQFFILIQFLCECFLFLLRRIVIGDNRAVIMLDICILEINDIRNRILDSLTYQHQCHTSRDAEDRHKQSFLVAEKISKR